MAPSYAKVFLSLLESEILAESPYTPETWLRFRDDIFKIWHHGKDKLAQFLELVNSHHATIKFTHVVSATVSFLHGHVSISDDRMLETDLPSSPQTLTSIC